jgi:hypothetical protein
MCFALTSEGKAKMWGFNRHQLFNMVAADYLGPELPDGPAWQDAYIRYPTDVLGYTDVIHLDGNWDGGIARRSNGEVWMWGYNESGVMGIDYETDNTEFYGPTRAYVGKESVGPVARGSFGTMSCAVDANCVPWMMGWSGTIDEGAAYPDFFTIGNPDFSLHQLDPYDAGGQIWIYADTPIPLAIVTGEL